MHLKVYYKFIIIDTSKRFAEFIIMNQIPFKNCSQKFTILEVDDTFESNYCYFISLFINIIT